jgi:hypothetical protein
VALRAQHSAAMLFGRIRRVHGTLKFIHSRTPDYIRLARQDVTAFRRELLEALLGLGHRYPHVESSRRGRHRRSSDVDMFAPIEAGVNGPCAWPERE